MILTTLLSLCTVSAVPPAATGPMPLTSAIAVGQDLKEEYGRRRAAAEGDVEKLWKLIDWCEANSLPKEKRSCVRAIIKLDGDDQKARAMLGHVYYDGQWFTSEKKLAAYKKKEEARIAKEKGLVKYKGGWADPDDIPYLEEGLVKGADGRWIDPEEQKRIAEGWGRQDQTWIPPDELANIDQGLWKCGDEWLSVEDADAYHAEFGRWWTIPGTYFVLYTTLPRGWAEEALNEVERTFRDLARIYGRTPQPPLRVLILNSGDQYNRFAGGTDDWGQGDFRGLSSVHGAFFADGWIDTREGKWMGAGVGHWDPSSESTVGFGRLFARHAAGLSFGHAIDPSPEALAEFAKNPSDGFVAAYWAEKKIPEWFRYGAASYVERYFTDSWVAQDGDPHWPRKYAVGNILRNGGLERFDAIFALEISPDNSQSANLISCAGLCVAFVLDGGCKPVIQKHQALKAALKSGKNKAIEKAFTALQEEIAEHEDDLRMWADL